VFSPFLFSIFDSGEIYNKEKILNGKKSLYILLVFIVGLAIGLAWGTIGAKFRWTNERKQLAEHLEQVNRDLNAAIGSQREASIRASRLQEELQGVTYYARSLETGTRNAEARAGSIAKQLDGIIVQSGELADGINRASGSLEESRLLIDELGTIVRLLPGGSGKTNQYP